MMRAVLATLVVAALAPPARADRDIHTGINMRTSLGTHRFRLELGGRWDRFESYVVLDPSSSRDGETDLDVVAMWWFRPAAWAGFVGWRNTSFNLLGENRWHEYLLVGISSRLPALGPSWLRTNVGLELGVDIVRHGSNAPTEYISFSSGRHWQDLVHVALFARIEAAVGY